MRKQKYLPSLVWWSEWWKVRCERGFSYIFYFNMDGMVTVVLRNESLVKIKDFFDIGVRNVQ